MTLVLAYNADSGIFNAITDTAHKLIAPQTYACRLCFHTYGYAGMRRTWKNFLEAQGLPLAFYHRNEFARAYPEASSDLPAIFLDRDGRLEELLPAETLDATEDLDDLMRTLQAALAGRVA